MPNMPSKYRAPALDKGLDILELLAHTSEPLTMTEVAAEIGHSKGEIFRMLQVLEERGYIARDSTGGFVITNRLFLLGMERPPVKTLVEAALPAMHVLAHQVMQTCHLVVVSGAQIVVIARVESPSDLSFMVRVGHQLPLAHSTSGAVLFAFQNDEVRGDWLAALDAAKVRYARKAFVKLADDIRAQGYATQASGDVDGVTDLSAPILRQGVAVGALTIPYVERHPAKVAEKVALQHLCAAAANISRELSV
ncbi:MAG TPA: IclR family transcriptional regulator [Rhodanobacteraceae bacterium]